MLRGIRTSRLRAEEKRHAEIDRLLAPKGTLILSVPIEVGVASLLKNVVRRAIGHSHSGASTANVLRALFGRRVERVPTYYWGHIGFDHRELAARLSSSGWSIARRVGSPWPLLGAGDQFAALFRGQQNDATTTPCARASLPRSSASSSTGQSFSPGRKQDARSSISLRGTTLADSTPGSVINHLCSSNGSRNPMRETQTLTCPRNRGKPRLRR
jgi:hypothetical protein